MRIRPSEFPPTPPEEVHRLLGDWCARYGFLIPGDERERLAASPPATVEDLVDQVFRASGLDPLPTDRLWKRVREDALEALRPEDFDPHAGGAHAPD